MATGNKALKAQNIPWIASFLVADCIIILVVLYPNALFSDQLHMTAIRITSAIFAPLIVLLLTSLLPSGLKGALVFWRIKHVLPGHRAFSHYAERDMRFDAKSLRTAIGEFPVSPQEQNTKWFSLYKEVEHDTSVYNAQRYYLLFRDLATLSVLLAAIVSVVALAGGEIDHQVVFVSGFFIIQYVVTAVAARNHGVAFVLNVLAIHATKRRN